ncbi:hypothetical protein C4568_00335 [Candidatus Parcubacteria bacterium]|nr:MAG: hypothetical protein C4568_00335 [Candidatus Parcubacteria bacterium]
MTQNNLIQIYKRYLEIRAEGKEEEATAFLEKAIEGLTPEDRNQLMTELAAMSLEEAVQERTEITDAQEDTIDMYNELEDLKKEMSEEGEKGA